MSSVAVATHPKSSSSRVRVSSARPQAIPSTSAARYVRRRLAVAAVAILCATAGVLLASTTFADAGQGDPAGRVSSGSASSGSSTSGSGTVVIVQPGDTLWSLAREVQPDGDVRPLVAQLARTHGGSSVRAGDRIVLPGR
jgi:nucleoid-associated protein YgaU